MAIHTMVETDSPAARIGVVRKWLRFWSPRISIVHPRHLTGRYQKIAPLIKGITGFARSIIWVSIFVFGSVNFDVSFLSSLSRPKRRKGTRRLLNTKRFLEVMTGPLKPIQKTKAQQVFGRLGQNKYNTFNGRNPAPPGILNDIESPVKKWDKLPTSTGEFNGFLNHQQYQNRLEQKHPSFPALVSILRSYAMIISLPTQRGQVTIGAASMVRKGIVINCLLVGWLVG